MPDIGATLREARMRARIDLSEIEAQTKIRARYLRALENEEWDVLPGPTFAKTFLRTYAEALGLDAKPLVEEYRRQSEHLGEGELQPIAGTARKPPRARRESGEGGDHAGGPSRGYVLAVGGIAVVIVVLIVALVTHGSKSPKSSPPANAGKSTATTTHAGKPSHHKHASHANASSNKVTLSLQASAVVWICLVDAQEHKLIPGVELQPGEKSGPYRGTRFDMILGNDAVKLTMNGRALSVPTSSEAIGYEVTSAGGKPLSAASEPSCT
jgi:cytoskeleton protein RodZ